MFERSLTVRIDEALGDTPVVLLQGARQTGKTTLARRLDAAGRTYRTLDDAAVRSAATADPQGFIAGLDGPVILDEIQLAPDLLPAIKAGVDRDRTPGRFLLTGSANVLVLPKVSESLAGRLELLTLWPLSQTEIERGGRCFVDDAFSDAGPRSPHADDDTWARVVTGGYPEILTRDSARRRAAWFGSYVTTILQRDVRDIANIEGLATLPRLLELLAARTGGLLNFADLSRSLSVPQSSLKRYFGLLEATFLVRLVRPWSTNLGKRLVKSPKIHLIDSGLACSLLGIRDAGVAATHTYAGVLLESFVVMELTKQATWSDTAPRLFHYRNAAGREVDVLLEAPDGSVVGIEVKAGATVRSDDFAGLRHLRELVGDRFRRGIVLHAGRDVTAFDADLVAAPVACLWAH